MKTIISNITQNQAFQINMDNAEYLTWADGSQITVEEIINQFRVDKHEDTYTLEHKNSDFRIENIELNIPNDNECYFMGHCDNCDKYNICTIREL